MDKFESGKKYNFKVKESVNGHKAYSIVEHDNKTYYYPKFLYGYSDVELIIQKVDQITGKVYFETDITKYLEDDIISTKLVSLNNENPINGELILNYKSHKVNVRFPKWMTSEKFSFSENILLKAVGLNLKKTLILYFPGELNHFKFKKESSYDLKFKGFRELTRTGFSGVVQKTTLLIVEDIDDGMIYDAKENFANTNLVEGDLYTFRYIGLDKNYKPNFIQDDKSIFLNPRKILEKKHLDFIEEEHLVNNKLRIDLLSQIDNSDNFWLLTMSRYLSEVVQSYIQRNRYLEARLATNIYKRVSGYIKSKNFFKKIPKTIANKTKPHFEEDLIKVKSAEDFLNFQENFEFEKLFKKEISFTLDHQISILKTLFNLKIIDRENILLLKKIFINLKEDRDIEEISKVVDQNLHDYFQNYILPIKDEFSRKYFQKFNDRNEWVEKNQVETVLEIAEFLKQNSTSPISHYYYSNYNLLESLIRFKEENNGIGSFKFYIKNLLSYNFNFISKKPPIIDKKSIIIYDRPIEIDTKFAYLIYEDKFIWISSFYCHTINFLIKEFGSVNLTISSIFKDCIYNTEFDLNLNLESFDILESYYLDHKAIIKTKSKHYYFATYGFKIDSEQNFLLSDSILYDDNKYQLPKSWNLYSRIGQIINLSENINLETAEVQRNQILKPDNKNRYNFSSHGEKFEVIILEKFYKNQGGACISCKDYELSYNGNHTKCSNCNSIYFDCIKVYIPKLEKFVYLNEDSFEDENSNFYNKLKPGDKFLFLFLSEFIYRLKHKSLDELIEINFQKVKSITFNGNVKNSSNEYSIYKNRLSILHSLFTFINDIITSNLSSNDRHNLINLNILIGFPLKSPKSYLLQFLNNYDELIQSIKNSTDIVEKVKMVKERIDDKYVQTSEIFPQIKQLFESVEIVSQINNEEYTKQFQLLNSTKGFNNKLIKSVLINNLIASEDKNSPVLNHVTKGIIDLMQRERDEISFNIGRGTKTEISKEIRLLTDIRNNVSSEGQNLEFKETLFVPVLNNAERNRIRHLEREIENKPNKQEENLKTISEIKKEVKKKLGNKTVKSELAYSAIKNICAFLNSNEGVVIIGVRDDNTLVGIEDDINLCGGDFDGFLQDFENYWKKFVQDSSYFRPYVKINKITFEGLDFCFMDVTYPYDIKDPCFIKEGNKDNSEKCYLKESSTTNSISGRNLLRWKRKTIPQTNQPTYVYVMIDKYENYKIGISKNVNQRQGTLMSQERSIKLLKSFIFPNRNTALRLENHLHAKYDKYRTETGGEWFNIDENHVNEIELFLNEQMSIFPTDKKIVNNLTLDI